ncbi:hypothetical protein L3V83_15310 [Thiotrichales bacterium 19X7-9]|nr:hypothetical protein [Thiotrichales bacterium 19X7-9]
MPGFRKMSLQLDDTSISEKPLKSFIFEPSRDLDTLAIEIPSLTKREFIIESQEKYIRFVNNVYKDLDIMSQYFRSSVFDEQDGTPYSYVRKRKEKIRKGISKFHNMLLLLISDTILNQENLEDAARMYSFYISLAGLAADKGNAEIASNIIFCLNTQPIYRLFGGDTKKGNLSSMLTSETRKNQTILFRIFNSSNNYADIRNFCHYLEGVGGSYVEPAVVIAKDLEHIKNGSTIFQERIISRLKKMAEAADPVSLDDNQTFSELVLVDKREKYDKKKEHYVKQSSELRKKMEIDTFSSIKYPKDSCSFGFDLSIYEAKLREWRLYPNERDKIFPSIDAQLRLQQELEDAMKDNNVEKTKFLFSKIQGYMKFVYNQEKLIKGDEEAAYLIAINMGLAMFSAASFKSTPVILKPSIISNHDVVNTLIQSIADDPFMSHATVLKIIPFRHFFTPTQKDNIEFNKAIILKILEKQPNFHETSVLKLLLNEHQRRLESSKMGLFGYFRKTEIPDLVITKLDNFIEYCLKKPDSRSAGVLKDYLYRLSKMEDTLSNLPEPLDKAFNFRERLSLISDHPKLFFCSKEKKQKQLPKNDLEPI